MVRIITNPSFDKTILSIILQLEFVGNVVKAMENLANPLNQDITDLKTLVLSLPSITYTITELRQDPDTVLSWSENITVLLSLMTYDPVYDFFKKVHEELFRTGSLTLREFISISSSIFKDYLDTLSPTEYNEMIPDINIEKVINILNYTLILDNLGGLYDTTIFK